MIYCYLLVLVTLVRAGSSSDKCLALAMSGGGAIGSYEAGALYGLVMNSKDKS